MQRKTSHSSNTSSTVANNIVKEVNTILGPSWYNAEAEFQKNKKSIATNISNNKNDHSKNSITRIIFVAMYEDKEALQLEKEEHDQKSMTNNSTSSYTKKVMFSNTNVNKRKKLSPINKFINQLKSSSSSTTSDYPINGDNDIITGGIILLTNNSYQEGYATTPAASSSSYSSNKTTPTIYFSKVAARIPVLGFIESSPYNVNKVLNQILKMNHDDDECSNCNLFHSIRILSMTEDCPTREYEFDFELYVAPSQSTTTADNNNDENNSRYDDEEEDNSEHINELIKSEGGSLNVATDIFTKLCSNEAKQLFSNSKLQKYDYTCNTELLCKVFSGSNASTSTAAKSIKSVVESGLFKNSSITKSITTIASTTSLLRKVIPSVTIIEACTKYKGYPTLKEFLHIFDSSILVELEGNINSSYPQLLKSIIDFDQILRERNY